MIKKIVLLASLSFLRIVGVFCQEYLIDADGYVPYAFNEAKLSSFRGFGEPVYLFAEFPNGNDALVFQTEKLNYAKELTAKYYSMGSALALALYLDAGKKTLLAREDLRQPARNTGGTAGGLTYLYVQTHPVLKKMPKINPAGYAPFVLLLTVSVAIALAQKKIRAVAPAVLILLAAVFAATVMVLFFSEKPEIVEISAGDAVISPFRDTAANTGKYAYARIADADFPEEFKGYVFFILKSSGDRRLPLDPLGGLSKIMFDKIPVIELSDTGEYFLKKNTSLKAWMKYD